MGNVSFILAITVVIPLIILIHEMGHAFFARIFGGEITNITLGMGKKICTIGILDIRILYLAGGTSSYKNLKKDSKISKILILLGGVIFNIITMALVFVPALILYPKYNIESSLVLSTIFHTFLEFSFMVILFNILPIKMINMNTDGLQLYQLIRYGKSSLYTG